MKSLVEAKHAIYNYFINDDSISPAENFDAVKFDCEDKHLKIAIISEVLQELEKDGLVRKILVETSAGSKTHWVLLKPLAMYPYTITCGYDTVASIANVINTFLKNGGNTRDFVDTSSLNETNLRTLVLITESLLAKK